MKQVDISEMTIEQLKALAYDLVVEKTRIEQNLMILQKEIQYKLSNANKESKDQVQKQALPD